MKRLAVSAFLAAWAHLILGLAGARADVIEFTIAGLYNVSFELDAAKAPDGAFKMKGPYFENVHGTLNGAAFIFPYVTFYSSAFDGGVTGATMPGEYGDVYFDMYGPALYSGPVSDPLFTVGTFKFFNLNGVEIDTVAIDAVAITNAPEPSTWAMMILGFAALGFGGLRKAKHVRSALQG